VRRWLCRTCLKPAEVRGNVSLARPDVNASTLLGRYRAFLPFARIDPSASLGEGGTPLLAAASLGRLLGLEQLFFKLESLNPSGDWDDRGSAAGVQRAKELGCRAVGVVWDGFSQASLPAYAARAGLGCYILTAQDVPAHPSPPTTGFGQRLVHVRAPYDALRQASRGLDGVAGVYFVNPDDPFRAEGLKTLAFELAEQCPQGPPDCVVVGQRSARDLWTLLKGFREWREAGLGDLEPSVIVAGSIDGALREGPPNDREVEAARRLLAAEEGLSVSADSAAAFVGLVREARAGRIPSGARVILLVTGRDTVERTHCERSEEPPIRTSLRGLGRVLADPVTRAACGAGPSPPPSSARASAFRYRFIAGR